MSEQDDVQPASQVRATRVIWSNGEDEGSCRIVLTHSDTIVIEYCNTDAIGHPSWKDKATLFQDGNGDYADNLSKVENADDWWWAIEVLAEAVLDLTQATKP